MKGWPGPTSWTWPSCWKCSAPPSSATPISPALGDQEYGSTASLLAVGEAITHHGRPPARICTDYDHAAATLADMVRYGDVVVSLGTGNPYLTLDALAALVERAS